MLRRPIESALDPAIGVMDQAGQVVTGVLAPPDAHLQSVEREVRVEPRGDLPADDEPRELVGDEGDVDPTGKCMDIGDVRDPELIRPGRDELPVHKIQRPPSLRSGLRRPRALRPRDAAQSRLAHEATHCALSDFLTLPTQLRMDLPDPVDTVVVGMDPADQHEQFLVTD